MKIAIINRVIQGYRTPVFERLAKKFDIKVFYGCDFPGTKVVNKPGPYQFPSKKMYSIPFGIKRKKGNMLLPFSPGIFFDLFRFKPDVVICEGASNFLNNIFVFIYCKLYKKAMIQWGLGELKGKKEGLIRKILNPFIKPIERRADAIICYSTYGTNYYKKLGINPDKIFIAVNVVDTDKRLQEMAYVQNQTKKIDDGKFRILFIGAIEPNKKLENLISSFQMLFKKFDQIELHIVGDGISRKQIEDYVMNSEISSSVFFHGAMQGALAPLACEMDVFVMPGLGGLAISDMLCHGLPVICSLGDGCEGDLIDGSNGMIIEDLTPEKIALVLTDLILSPEKLNQMKKNTLKIFEKHNINSYIESISAAIMYSTKPNKN